MVDCVHQYPLSPMFACLCLFVSVSVSMCLCLCVCVMCAPAFELNICVALCLHMLVSKAVCRPLNGLVCVW